MSEYDYNHDRDRHTEQGEGIIRKYERYMYGGRVPRDRIEENSPNATIEELDEDDIQILNLVGIDEKQELTPEDEREINQVFQAGIPTAIVGTYGTTLGTKVIWKSFAKVIIQRFGVVAAQALGLSAADGLLPVGEAIALGLLAVTAWQIYRNWDELWRDAEQILVQQEPEPQVYTTPSSQVETPRHTGHAPPEVETGTPEYETPQVETLRHTGHEREQLRAEDFVMESNTNKPWRADLVLNDGNLKEGWIHIEARHITGTHPSPKHADMFEPDTTRAEIEQLAREVIKNGTRISDPRKVMQSFELKTVFQDKREWFRASIKTTTDELVTIFPIRSEK